MRWLRRLSLVRACLRRKQARIEELERFVLRLAKARVHAECRASRLQDTIHQQHLVIARLKTDLAALERVEG